MKNSKLKCLKLKRIVAITTTIATIIAITLQSHSQTLSQNQASQNPSELSEADRSLCSNLDYLTLVKKTHECLIANDLRTCSIAYSMFGTILGSLGTVALDSVKPSDLTILPLQELSNVEKLKSYFVAQSTARPLSDRHVDIDRIHNWRSQTHEKTLEFSSTSMMIDDSYNTKWEFTDGHYSYLKRLGYTPTDIRQAQKLLNDYLIEHAKLNKEYDALVSKLTEREKVLYAEQEDLRIKASYYPSNAELQSALKRRQDKIAKIPSIRNNYSRDLSLAKSNLRKQTRVELSGIKAPPNVSGGRAVGFGAVGGIVGLGVGVLAPPLVKTLEQENHVVSCTKKNATSEERSILKAYATVSSNEDTSCAFSPNQDFLLLDKNERLNALKKSPILCKAVNNYFTKMVLDFTNRSPLIDKNQTVCGENEISTVVKVGGNSYFQTFDLTSSNVKLNTGFISSDSKVRSLRLSEKVSFNLDRRSMMWGEPVTENPVLNAALKEKDQHGAPLFNTSSCTAANSRFTDNEKRKDITLDSQMTRSHLACATQDNLVAATRALPILIEYCSNKSPSTSISKQNDKSNKKTADTSQ